MMESLNSHVIFIEKKKNKTTLGFDLKMSETDLKHWGKCVDSISINACLWFTFLHLNFDQA